VDVQGSCPEQISVFVGKTWVGAVAITCSLYMCVSPMHDCSIPITRSAWSTDIPPNSTSHIASYSRPPKTTKSHLCKPKETGNCAEPSGVSLASGPTAVRMPSGSRYRQQGHYEPMFVCPDSPHSIEVS
jgi:hypothetical protein